jgi:uncharacterized phage protein (TIGR02218 family)
MTYSAKELSVEESSPVYLVQFIQGATTWRYTTIAESISRSGSTWYPSALQLGKFACTGEIPKDALTVKLPVTDSVAQTFLGYPPEVMTSVTVFRTHYDDADVLCYWKGRVSGFSITGGVLALTCEPIFSSLKRMGLRPVYQKCCRHALFGAGCNVDPDNFAHSVTATVVLGSVVTVPDAAALDLTGGTLMTANGTIRMIVAQNGADLTLMRAIKGLAPGAVTVYDGCAHDIDACRDKFHNLGNYGGFPGIPTKNPMGVSLTVVD